MKDFARCFARNGYGTWLCISPGELVLTQGRIQVAPGLVITAGSRFMGVDLSELLEDEARKREHSGRV
jgi:hypothetical protein